MCLVVEFEGVVGVGLLGLLLHLRVLCNPVKKFGAIARVFGAFSFSIAAALSPLRYFAR